MAETAANDAALRYAVIEQAYSKENWAEVLNDGGELLNQLRTTGDPQLAGLRMRLQLLMGHTHLYGFADKAAAAEFYRAVASQSGEAALAQIAEQGLNQCNAVEAPAAGGEPLPMAAEPEESAAPEPVLNAPEATGPKAAPAASPFTTLPAMPEVTPSAGGGTTSPAAPWLTEMTPTPTPTPAPAPLPTNSPAPTPSAEPAAAAMDGTPAATAEAAQPLMTDGPTAIEPAAPWAEESLIPEVVEEPELIELHQADPTLAEEVELAWKAPAPTPALGAPALSREDEELLSGLMLVRIR
jgi:hypothetical protein